MEFSEIAGILLLIQIEVHLNDYWSSKKYYFSNFGIRDSKDEIIKNFINIRNIQKYRFK